MLTLRVVIQDNTIIQKKENNKSFFSVKQIFQENWEEYLETHNPREIEIKEVEKIPSLV